ncbi:hypothetical protein FVP74_13895 [Microbacterium saccharophilum]|uniref:RiboL-PSP-HEPN domain-containing protein n=1 Tax=Microbacterium saccharophilum TaxID=1213358 RepID=A0A5C8HTB9_9MICO|nr:hypothetical protein [Microbacterium saccharophilum]TXK08342.1 hypothetical protein FVP74_13895 [Microbacterium saccharophilum]GEP48673.1 hypothetical protein MSA03_21810 [Microbacterium saccharophilum]
MTNHPLLAEIAEIESTLLSDVSTAPPDPLSTRERTVTRAYLLVAHAILEERIEGIFLEHFNRARRVIAEGVSVPVGLLPFFAAALEWNRDIPTYNKRQWLGVMSSPLAIEYVTSEVRENHGLKADNVRDLAKLVGIEWAVIDDAVDIQLAALTTLGAKRGAAGHTSPFNSPTQAVTEEEYPANVREWVEQAARTVIALESVVDQLSAQSQDVRKPRWPRMRLRSRVPR